MKSNEHKLGDLLGGALARAGILRQVGAAIVVDAGDNGLVQLFGEGILEFVRCRSFQEKILTCVSNDASVAQEVRLREREIIRAITEQVPQADVEEIVVWHRASTRRGAAWYDVP